MGLEAATYIDGLTTSWPLAGDNKSVGDDHLRLIKSVLKSTFPAATKPFYFPTAEAVSSAIVLDVTDQNSIVMVDTSAGNVAVTLPALGAGDKGWSCEIMKISGDTNAVIVSPAAGLISSKAGATATIRVGVLAEPCRFVSNTSGSFYAVKPGAVIGATYNWDASATPAGFLDIDGSAYSSTDFAELFAILATSTLKDKRGRVEIGSGTGTGLTNRVLGTNYGAETVALALAELPTGITSTNASSIALSVTTTQKVLYGANTGSAVGGGTQITVSDPGSGGTHNFLSSTGTIAIGDADVTSNNTSGTGHANLQPSIAAKKIIRAC